MDEMISNLNRRYNGEHGYERIQFSYRASENNDGTGEIWIMRAPNAVNDEDQRTGKNFTPIRLSVDEATLRGHHGEHTVLSLRGKLITDKYEFKHNDPRASMDDRTFTDRSWIRRSSYDVAEDIIARALGTAGEETRRNFGMRLGYLTDPYGGIGDTQTFKQMKQRGDTKLNAIANTITIQQPVGYGMMEDRTAKKNWNSHLDTVAKNMGFQPGTFGLIAPGTTNRSEASRIPIRDLEGTNRVQQATHFAYAAGGYDPKTGKAYGPVDTGRVTMDNGQTYSTGYAADPASEASRLKTLGKEGKRASLDQRATYMPDDDPRIKVEKYTSGGRQRMNRVVVVAREGDDVGAGGSISSISNMRLRAYTPYVQKRVALPKGFNLAETTFTGRAERGSYTQAGGTIAIDNDPLSNKDRSVRVDRVGLEGVEIGTVTRKVPKMALNPATNKMEPEKDAAGNVVMRDEERPEFRVNLGYDEDTVRMVRDFGFKIGTETYDGQKEAELRKIFSADVANAKSNGKWRKGVSAETKRLYGIREQLTQKVVEHLQERNEGVWVSAAQNQGGSTSGRTSFDFQQRKAVDNVGGKGGSMKQTYREKLLPDNPEEGGEVDRYLSIAQTRLARAAMGNRALERLVYQQDRKGNFINTAPDASAADEIDSVTGLYKYRVMRSMSGRDVEAAQRRIARVAVREQREANRQLIALQQSTSVLTGVNPGDVVRISTGVGPDQMGVLDQMGKRVEITQVPKKKGNKTKSVSSIVDDPDFATVRVQTGNMIPQMDASGNYVMDPATGRVAMVPEERVESYRVSSNPAQAQIFRTDKAAEISAAEQRLKKAKRVVRNVDNLGSDRNPFGRWMQNREELIQSEIGSEFLERYVNPVSTLVSIGEQKTDQKFQQEVLVGIFHTNIPEFKRAREAVRKRFGANDDDDINIWTSGHRGDGVTELNEAMEEVLKVAPRVFKQGEHPYFSAPGLYEPVNQVVDPTTGAISYTPGEWKVNTTTVIDPVTGKTTVKRDMEDIGHVAFVQSSTGFSPEYTGLGRMTSEMLRMLHRTSPELYEDIASQQIDPATGKGRPNVLMSLVPEMNPEVVQINGNSSLAILGNEADDNEKFEALLDSWHDIAKSHGVSNAATIQLEALTAIGETEGFKVASPDVFIGQEQSAVGRAYFNLLASQSGNYSIAEKLAARSTYQSELQTFFGQQETVKNALSVNKGMLTSFSRYVTDSSVADNEVVIGDDTVSIFAEQASKALGQNVSKEDVINALQSKEGVYGFAPRMPEVTEFMTPFRIRYDAKNKSVPRVNQYFSMLYMGDNDGDPLMMMLMGAFKKNADGSIGYSNFRRVKEMHDKAPSGLFQAMARLRSSMDPFEFEEKFAKAHETARVMLDYQLDNNLLYKKDEQGRMDKSEHIRLAAARADYLAGKGGDDYMDAVNKYAMSGLFRGRKQVDASGKQVMDPRDPTKALEIEGMKMVVGANRKTGDKGKGQNVEMDRQEDLRAGSPNSLFAKLTNVKRHVFGSEEVSEYNKREEQIYKGMGIFTYLKSMTSLWGDGLNTAIREALGPGYVDPMEKYATSKDRAKGGLGQYTDPGGLARENLGLEYQRAIDMGAAERNMEDVSKEFFTADVSDWMHRRSDILASGVKSLMESQNINAITAAAMLGTDKESVASIYKNILDYRRNMAENATPDQIAAARAAYTNVYGIANREKNIENSIWGRAMRARALINTQDNLNRGKYEEERTVEQRRQLRSDYHKFLELHKGAAADALQIGSLSRMRDSANAIAGAVSGFMKPILKAAGFDVSKVPDFESRVRKVLGGKSIDEMSLKPGPADDENRINRSIINGNGITEMARSGNYGINSSVRIQSGPIDEGVSTKVLRTMGGLKKPGEEFTQEELDALPISPSQLHYLADPNGDAHASNYGGVEQEGSLNSSAIGLINQVMVGLHKDTSAGAAPFHSDVNLGNRGMYKVISESFERGAALEEAVFAEQREKGMSNAAIASKFGYRTKGHVSSQFFGAEFDASGSAYNKGSISYEPDLIVATTDKSGKRVWEVRDIKTTSRINKSGGDELSNLYIAESGQWRDGELAGSYVVQQMAYVQAINEFGQNVQRKVTPLMQAGETHADVLRRIAADNNLAKDASGRTDAHLVDLAKQYQRMEEWFTSKEGAGLSPDRAKSDINSIISNGVVAGGLMYNIKEDDGSYQKKNGEIHLRNYDEEAQAIGMESGFAKLRGKTLNETRQELTKIRRAASANRIERVAENLPQYIASTINANKRWNRDRADVLSAINKNSGVITNAKVTSGSGPNIADNEQKGRLSRELAATLPYMRTIGAEKRGSASTNVTAQGLVAVESEFSKYGILNAGNKPGDFKELARITGLDDRINPGNAMDQRVRFRTLIGAAARHGRTKSATANGPQYADISDAEYTEIGTHIARFMGEDSGVERHASLQRLKDLNVLDDTDVAKFKGFANKSGGSLTESKEDTSKRLYAVLEKKYGAQRGTLVKDSRKVVDANLMHFSNLKGEDKEIQKGYLGSLVQTVRALVTKSPEAREAMVRAQDANGGLASVIDENGMPLVSITNTPSGQTPAQIADAVYAGRLSGVEAREQYSNSVIPSFPALPVPTGSSAASLIEEAKKYAHAAVYNVDPELANRILNANPHELPALMQEGFKAIGSPGEYLERAIGTSAEYSVVTESWRKAAEALQHPDAAGYFHGLKTSAGTAAEFLPPSIDTAGAVIGRDSTIPVTAPIAAPSTTGAGASGGTTTTSAGTGSGGGSTTKPAAGRIAPKSNSAINPTTGSVHLARLPVALSSDERTAVEKYNKYAHAKKQHEQGKISSAKLKKFELTPDEKKHYDAAVQKISDKEAELAAPPAPKAPPAPPATTGAPGRTPSRGPVTADPDRFTNNASQIVEYLRGFGKTTTVDPVSGVSVASYTTGKTRTEVLDLLAARHIGTTEQKLLFNLRDVFEQMQAGRPVSSTDLNEAFDRLGVLTGQLSMLEDGPEKEMAMDEIKRISSVLEGDASGKTRAAMASSGAGASALTTAAGSVSRTRASLAGGTKGTGPSSAARASYVDITTDPEHIQQAVDLAGIELARHKGKINTSEIHNSLRRELTSNRGALWHNQNIVNGGGGMANLRARVGWDSSRADAISKSPEEYKSVVEKTAAERKKTMSHLENVTKLIKNTKEAYAKTGKKFEDDPSTKEAIDILENVRSNLSSSLGEGGSHGILEDQISRAIANSRVNALDENAKIYETSKIVRAEIDAGTLNVPAGQTVNDFVHQETTERLAGKKPGAAVGAGYSKDEREELFNREYDSVKKQISNGAADVRGMFDQIKDFTEGLRKSSEGWLKKLSEDGQAAAGDFVKSLDEATKTLDKFAGMSETDLKNPEKAAGIFNDLVKQRKEQAEQIEKAESNPLLKNKEGAEIIRGAKENLAFIDSILGGSGDDDLATIAAKRMGKKPVQDALEKAGVPTAGGSDKKGREPLLGLLNAHAAYQQLVAVRTGIDPFVQAAEKYEQGRKNVNAILSGAGLNSIAPSMMAIGEEAKRSAEYRRGRSSGRLGAMLAPFENTGLFQMARDIFDPMKGAGIALVPLAEPITKWAKGSEAVAGLATRSAARVAASKAAEAAGTATLGTLAEGAMGAIGGFVSANPALVAIGGGMAASALFSIGGHLLAASQDKQGMAISREIASRYGAGAAFNADPWSSIVSGNPYAKTSLNSIKTGFGYEADMARLGAIAGDKRTSEISLNRPDAIKNYLDYTAIAGPWRDYAKALAVDSDKQKQAHAMATALLGGVKKGDEFERVTRRLIRAQTAEGADTAAALAEAMGQASGKFAPSDIAKYLDVENIPDAELSDEDKSRRESIKNDLDKAKADVVSQQKAQENTLYSANPFVFSGRFEEVGRVFGFQMASKDAKAEVVRLSNLYEDSFVRNKWLTNEGKIFLGNAGRVGSFEQLEKSAMQGGLSSKERETSGRVEGLVSNLAKKGIAIDERQGGLIADTLVGNKLFEQSMLAMNFGRENLAAFAAKLGPMDSTILDGQTYSGWTPMQREVYSQAASYAESIRNMRMQAGLPYTESAGQYASGLKFITDSQGRATALQRSSVDQNTFKQFQKDQINRLLDQYGLSDMNMFKSDKDFLSVMGWDKNRVSQKQDVPASPAAKASPEEPAASASTVNSSAAAATATPVPPAPVAAPPPPPPTPTPTAIGRGSGKLSAPAKINRSSTRPEPTATPEAVSFGWTSFEADYSASLPTTSTNASKVPYVSQLDNAPRGNDCGIASVSMLVGSVKPELANGETVTKWSDKYNPDQKYVSLDQLQKIAKDQGVNLKVDKNASYPYAVVVDNQGLPERNRHVKNGEFGHFIVRLSDTEYHDPLFRDGAGANLTATKEELDAAEQSGKKWSNVVPGRIGFADASYPDQSSVQSVLSSQPSTATVNSAATAAVLPTRIFAPPAATIAATKTAISPTATILPTQTPVPPTATVAATKTSIPPTATILPTQTRIPPTATVAATKTSVPPTGTPVSASPTPTSTVNAEATDAAFVAEIVAKSTAQAKATEIADIKTRLNSLRGIPLEAGAINLAYPSFGATPGEIPFYLRAPAATFVPTRAFAATQTPTNTPTTAAPTATEKSFWAAPYTPTPTPTSVPTTAPILIPSPTPDVFASFSQSQVVFSPALSPTSSYSVQNVSPTHTPVSPTPTKTPVPPTATPAPTKTPVPPTATATNVPATATAVPTKTPVLSTATAAPTETLVVPTATATATATKESRVYSPAIAPNISPIISPIISPLASPLQSPIPTPAAAAAPGGYAGESHIPVQYGSVRSPGRRAESHIPVQYGSVPSPEDVVLSPVEQQSMAEVSQMMAKMRLSDVLGGQEPKDYSWFASRLYKKDRNGLPVQDPFVAANTETRNQLVSSGGARVLNAFGISGDMITAAMTNPSSALFMQTMGAFAAGDAATITAMSSPEGMKMMNGITGGAFGEAMQKYGIGPMIDVSTGGPLFERSMVGLINPATGVRTTSQSEITSGLIKSTFDPIRKQLFGNTASQLNSAAYSRINDVIAGNVYSYVNPNTGKTVKMGSLAGLQMESNQRSYTSSMASIGVQREQMQYARERQLAWDFPVQETQNQIATAQMLGGVVQTDWMKKNGIGPLDFSGGTILTQEMKDAGMTEGVTYEGGQIGQQKFNLRMSRLEAKRGFQQGQARMGWQLADLSREIGRSRVRADWQREDFSMQQSQMTLARDKQAYDFGFQAREMGISRQQFREDVAFQQRQRQLQFGWQMEDADINIRRATGFERRQLIKQKERETISFNMDTEQINRQNKRQEEAFKREEEKFKKEMDHYKKSIAFEDEAFSRQKKRFEQQRLWEEEDYKIKVGRINEEMAWSAEAYQRQLARFAVEENLMKQQEHNEGEMKKWRDAQHQEDMNRAAKNLELNKKSLDISAGAVANQKIIADQQVIINQMQMDSANSWSLMMNSVDWEKVLKSIKEFVQYMEEHGFTKPIGADSSNGNRRHGGETNDNGTTMKAFGGFVSSGKSFLVGELGPEILNVGKDGQGYILPNSAIPKDRSISRQGGGEVIHIHVMMDSNEIATYTSDKANGLAARNRRRAFNG